MRGERLKGTPNRGAGGAGGGSAAIRRVLCLFVASATIGACAGSDAAEDARPTVRDSAGIAIVEHPAGAAEAADRWRLAPEPILEIGSRDDPEQQLHRVRGAVRLTDGTVVVANGGSNELWFYGPEGALVRKVGGEGEGPGEFTGLEWLGVLPPDSLLAYDWRQRRASVFDTAGTFGRSFSLESAGEGGTPRIMGVWPEEEVLLVRQNRVFRAGEERGGLHRDSMPMFRYDGSGTVLDSLGLVPGSEAFVVVRDRSMMVTSLPFGRAPALAVAPDGFWLGSSDRWELERRSADGSLRRLVRLERANRPVSSSDVERFRDRRLEATSEDRRSRTRRMLDDLPWPEQMPAYDAVAVDPDDRLWVREYVPEWEETTRWLVFDDEGRLEAIADAPRSLEFLEVGRDEVVALRRDELDVEYVGVYPIERDGGG